MSSAEEKANTEKESLTYILTYLLTPWCRVLPEQLLKKFPAFHGTRRFITVHTTVRHLSLSWASPIQSIYPHPTACISILILFTHLRLGLPSGLFPSGFPTKTLCTGYTRFISSVDLYMFRAYLWTFIRRYTIYRVSQNLRHKLLLVIPHP